MPGTARPHLCRHGRVDRAGGLVRRGDPDTDANADRDPNADRATAHADANTQLDACGSDARNWLLNAHLVVLVLTVLRRVASPCAAASASRRIT